MLADANTRSEMESIFNDYQNHILPLIMNDKNEYNSHYTYDIYDEFNTAENNLSAKVDLLMDHVVLTGTDISDHLTSYSNLIASVLIIAVIIAAIVALIISYTTIMSINKPVKELEAAYLEVSRGNLDIDIQYQSQNELGVLADAVRYSVHSLSGYIKEIEIALTELGSGRLEYTPPDIFEGDFSAIKEAIDKVSSLLRVQQEHDLESREKLEKAYLAADNANRAKSDFLSNMSHDIRTPMNAIVGLTGIALANIDDTSKVTDCLKKISQSGVLLIGLINDILDMSKIESGKMALNLEHAALSEVMDNIVNVSYTQIRNKKQQFSIRLHHIQHESIYCDPVRMNQIFINILSNAVKFTPVGGSITVDVTELPSKRPGYAHYQFIFADTGIGMKEEFLENIFTSFAREENVAVRRTEGSGLGMAICKKIVDLMEGTISVKSKEGHGSEFTIDLHLKIAEKIDSDISLKDMHILLVDDDPIVCETSSETLSEMGVIVEWVDNGYDAVDKIVSRKGTDTFYDAVIMDLQMPEMNGIDTTKRIRELVGADLPIIIMSAYDWSDFSDKATAAGVNGYVPKPLFKSKLYYAITQFVLMRQDNGPIALTDTSSFDFSGKRILLAEDNEINQMVAVEMLSLVHAQVSCADNGAEALMQFEQSEPFYFDAILMDIQMPIMNGYDATQKIRGLHREDAATVPIIAMTANAFSEDVENAFNAGMNSHISKPVDYLRLLREIERFIQ